MSKPNNKTGVNMSMLHTQEPYISVFSVESQKHSWKMPSANKCSFLAESCVTVTAVVWCKSECTCNCPRFKLVKYAIDGK